MPVRRIFLIGFMASGKTEVGRELARRLGWRHLDTDALIERKTGKSIPSIFASMGEPAFRALEVEVTPEVAALDQVVVSTGGGWITNSGLLETLPSDTFTVYLQVTAAEVERRLGRSRSSRPLLAGDDATERIKALLAQREPLYLQANLVVDTVGRSKGEIAALIAKAVERNAGSPTSDDDETASPDSLLDTDSDGRHTLA